ncbi:MAG: hypothetical protein ACYCST_21150, partial [Acidimicrobiales bacterium]
SKEHFLNIMRDYRNLCSDIIYYITTNKLIDHYILYIGPNETIKNALDVELSAGLYLKERYQSLFIEKEVLIKNFLSPVLLPGDVLFTKLYLYFIGNLPREIEVSLQDYTLDLDEDSKEELDSLLNLLRNISSDSLIMS